MPEARLLDTPKAMLSGISWRGAAEILVLFGALNLLWEIAQLPLYGIWYEASLGDIAFAVLHCTVGDVLIGINSTIVALLVAAGLYRSTHPPLWAVGLILVLIATTYTIYSEWLNVLVRKSWSYSELMPTISPLGTGLSPMAQWLILPAVTIWIVKSRRRRP